MTTATAPAKLNLALVVGPRREDGKHELVTVYERIDIVDTLRLESADSLRVEGFPADTLVTRALCEVATAAGIAPAWRVTIDKRIPTAAGLGGGSSDAAAALRLANETLDSRLADARLHALAIRLGADVPFFLTTGAQLGEGDGTRLTSVVLPHSYVAVVVLPNGAVKHSTKAVYDAFDDRDGAAGFEERRAELVGLLAKTCHSHHLAAWPKNDLVYSPLAGELERLGAFRADVSGAGPALYGLFEDEADARRAAATMAPEGRVWVAFPTWYG